MPNLIKSDYKILGKKTHKFTRPRLRTPPPSPPLPPAPREVSILPLAVTPDPESLASPDSAARTPAGPRTTSPKEAQRLNISNMMIPLGVG